MTPQALSNFLDRLISTHLMLSVMIWGPPGVGKSSVVAQTAARHDLACIDLRLSQLAPTDLRGLPVAADGVSRWYPPEFLPREGSGVLFLDEINLAPPAMQGMAQQLILDRRVGSYCVPDKWFIWAAGNRKEDRAAVFDMPAPLANRFAHLTVEPDFESFKSYALAASAHEQMLAFLSFRPELLHKLDPQQPAWPSPRSWMMASALHAIGLDVAPAVGVATAAEFAAFLKFYQKLPDIDRILQGNGERIAFPTEPSVRYATTIGLTMRATTAHESYTAFRWLADRAGPEWAQLFAVDLFRLARARNEMGALVTLAMRDERLKHYLDDYLVLLAE
ncbi:MAG TPA: MoxR family ATPase [Ktedonobacterales bacterium]|nr:MoxR family ATPase [Ktedonobacterales bacterium]